MACRGGALRDRPCRNFAGARLCLYFPKSRPLRTHTLFQRGCPTRLQPTCKGSSGGCRCCLPERAALRCQCASTTARSSAWCPFWGGIHARTVVPGHPQLLREPRDGVAAPTPLSISPAERTRAAFPIICSHGARNRAHAGGGGMGAQRGHTRAHAELGPGPAVRLAQARQDGARARTRAAREAGYAPAHRCEAGRAVPRRDRGVFGQVCGRASFVRLRSLMKDGC